MKRSAGIIISATIAILVSVVLFGLGALTANIAIGIRYPPPKVFFIGSIVFFALGMFGIIAAIGLLRLKNWARIGFVVFSGMLCLFCIFGAFVTLMLMLFPLIYPSRLNSPSALLMAIFAFYLVVELAVGALAVWSMIYFSSRRMEEQFLNPVEAAMPLPGRSPF